MLVKCKSCGTKIERDTAYKVVLKDKNSYYCNEQEYLNYKQDLKNKDDVYMEIDNIFNKKITNTVLFKEVGELSKIYTYETILLYLQQNEQYLINVLNKSFVSEYAQIRYFTAILKNSLSDFERLQKETRKIEIKKIVEIDTQNIYNNNYKPQQRKKTLAKIELEMDGE
jgi:YHS domain-containing protein